MTFKKPDEADNPLSSEEDRLHEEGMAQMRAAIAQGKTFAEAAAALPGVQGIRELVADDFLKIFIAEEYFEKNRTVGEVAMTLGLAYEKVEAAREIMLEEVGMELARQYRQAIDRQAH